MSDLNTWTNFPRIELIVNGNKKYYRLTEAIPFLDSGLVKVICTQQILERDFRVRKMTKDEYNQLIEKTDEYSGSK